MARKVLKNGTQGLPHRTTKPGVKPSPCKKLPVPGSGRGRPAIGYNQETRQWDMQ